MACGCMGASKDGSPKEWVFTNTKGEQRTFKTEIEARAAQIRSGGGGNIAGKG